MIGQHNLLDRAAAQTATLVKHSRQGRSASVEQLDKVQVRVDDVDQGKQISTTRPRTMTPRKIIQPRRR